MTFIRGKKLPILPIINLNFKGNLHKKENKSTAIH